MKTKATGRWCWALGLLLLTSACLAQTREETSLWQSIKDSKDADDYGAYLDKYPNGVYAPLAKRRIASLPRSPDASTEVTAATPAHAAAAPNATAATSKPDPGTKAIPTDEKANTEVNEGFSRWSAGWMFDRFIPGSAHATERGFKDGTYVIRGMFDFVRSGAKISIPYAASYSKSDSGYNLSNLCYNDTSTNMTDCINPNNSADLQQAGMQSRQFLGSIVAVGMMAAMSTEETCYKHYTFFGEPYLECYH